MLQDPRWTYRLALAALAAMAIAFLLIRPAPAQNASSSFFLPRGEMIEWLTERFDEHQIGIGQVNGQAVVELFVSEDGSWTAFATTTNGISCVLASGNGWTGIQVPRGEPT